MAMSPLPTPGQCAHCWTAIIDPTTQVVHGDMTYCCANCAAAMEQQVSGSDPETRDHPNELRCSHCGAPIVDDSSVESRDDLVFCCRNCAAAVVGAQEGRA